MSTNEDINNQEEEKKNKSTLKEQTGEKANKKSGKKNKKNKEKKGGNVEEEHVEKNEEIQEEHKEKPKEAEIKKEESKKEEIKEEAKNEEDKKEEKKEEGPKIEGEKKEEKKEPKKPREPEPKIPTDFTELIKEINGLKKEGNELYKNGSLEEAISKYKMAYEKLQKEIPKIDRERDYNPQSSELFTLFIQISQNLSLCYFKTNKYEESIKLDNQIIARDKHYDKSYYRLFQSYLKLDKKAEAVYFGNILLNFDEETKKKYEEVIPIIEETKKIVQSEYDAIRAKARKEMFKSIAKYAVPIIILIAAFAIYFFVFKKKKIGK